MASPIPQSVPPGVMFDIPLEKKVRISRVCFHLSSSPASNDARHLHNYPQEIKDSPAVQKRLETSPPKKPFSIHDIVKKLTDAGKRRENVASASKSKTSAHNSTVKEISESYAKRAVADPELESRIASKLDGANARREDLTAKMVQKVSEKTNDKIERGSKALKVEELSTKELEEQIRLKEEAAEARREYLIASKVSNLACQTNGKIARGKLAMELSDIEARHKGNQLNQKLTSATHRREMANLFKTIDKSDLAADKRERAMEVKFIEEEKSSSKATEVDEKLKSAEERRTKASAETVEQLSAKTKDKLRRGADAIQEKHQRSKLIRVESEKKLENASQRRMEQIQAVTEASSKAFALKEQKKEKQMALEAAQLKVQEKKINTKILKANLRKEELIMEKTAKILDSHQKKQERAVMAMQMELEEAAQLGKKVDKKLKTAALKRDQIVRESTDDLYVQNKMKREKIDTLLNQQELKEMKRFIEIENKLASADAKRKEKLTEVATKSSSKKRVNSPKPSPTKSEIDARINKAAARREMFLLTKIDKATASSTKKLSPRCELFRSVTPRSDDNIKTTSPRIKAARLNNISNDDDHHHKDVGGLDLDQFTMMPIIATSIVGLVLIGVISYWK